MLATFTRRHWIHAAFALLPALLTGCATTVLHSKPGTSTTVILTRHADRDHDAEVLNARGQERAQALIAAVRDYRVTAIYSPNVRRNLDTVRPLAQHLGIDITPTPAVSLFAAEAIVEEILTRHAGGVVVYAGNASGNIQAVYRHLGGTGAAPVEYGDLFVMTIPDQGPATIVRKRYGP